MQISTKQSPMNWLASQPPATWQRFLANLSREQKKMLAHKWRGWRARPNQLAPEGNWRGWLILAGRGFGKTRSGGGGGGEQGGRQRCGGVAFVGETAAGPPQAMGG